MLPFVTAGWLGVCAIWASLLVAQIRAKRRGVFLEARLIDSADARISGTRWPTVCVLIPARNEGSRLAACLESVLAQDYPVLEVVVVDDRSEDDTGAVAARLAVSDARLRVVRNDQLPTGWLGKSHALWRATRDVTAEWILFLDADTELAPSAVRIAVGEAACRDVELLTLWPRTRAEGFWERALIPLCAGIIALWYGSDRVNDPGSKRAFANGQFLLIRREAYERIGGHRSVHSALIEDIPLAEHAKQAGVRCCVASGRELFSVRMYSTYNAVCDGWARIFVGALRSRLKIALSLAWLALGSLLPIVAAPILALPPASSLVLTDSAPYMSAMLRSCCGLHLALLMTVSLRFWGFGACRRSYLILYPLSVILVMGILCRAWWWLAIRRSVPWSATIYRINRKGAIIGLREYR